MTRKLAAGGLFAMAVLVLAFPSAAAAQGEPPNATGPCRASATLSNGVVVNPYESSGVYEMPLSGSASYSGAVTADVTTPRAISGEVRIITPPGIPDITLTDEWVWDDPEADGISSDGDVSWNLPKSLPRGVEMLVDGFHSEPGVLCEGSVIVKLEGGFLDSPVSYVAIGGTVVGAIGLLLAMFSSGASVTPNPIPGGQ